MEGGGLGVLAAGGGGYGGVEGGGGVAGEAEPRAADGGRHGIRNIYW